MADLLNVSKQRVYRCIKANHITEAHCEVVKGNTVLMYDIAAFMRIKNILTNDSASSEAHHDVLHEAVNDTPNEAVHEALLKQLEIKDNQIMELNDRLREALKALNQAQQLQALSEHRIKLLESRQVNDKPSMSTGGEEQDEDAPKGFFGRFFKKNR